MLPVQVMGGGCAALPFVLIPNVLEAPFKNLRTAVLYQRN